MKVNSFFVDLIHPRLQICLFFINAFFVITLILIKQNIFTAFERPPMLFPFTPAIIKSWGGDPKIVKVGMNIINFPSFNLINSDFIIDIVVWFEYDPAHVSAETLGKFSFERGEIVQRSNSDSKKIGSKLLTKHEVRVKFSSPLDARLFPMDQHRIFLSLINTYVFPSDILLESEKKIFIISEGLRLDEWYVIDRNVSYGYSETFLEEGDEKNVILYPKVTFSVDFARMGMRKVLLIFLPLFFIFFISLISLAFNPTTHKHEILSLSFGSISSLIGYRFVIQGLSPNVGYFMLSDYIFTLLFSLMFFIFLVDIIIIQKGEIEQIWNYIRSLLLCCCHLVFTISWYILLFRWYQ